MPLYYYKIRHSVISSPLLARMAKYAVLDINT